MDKIKEKWNIFLREGNKGSYQVYCDMDGVLVDLEAGIEKRIILSNIEDEVREKAIQVLHSGELWQKMREEEGFDEGVDAIFNVLSSGGFHERESFWATLPPEPDMHVLWRFISKYNPIILSAPWTLNGEIDTACESGKRMWLERLDPQPVKVILTLNKNTEVQDNHILIDDMDKYVGPWGSAGGIAIKHMSAANTIKELKKWLR